MASRPTVINVTTEFYDVIKDYDTGNYLVQDDTLSVRDTALLHTTPYQVVCIYRGERTTRNNINYEILELDNSTEARGAVNVGRDNLIYFRVLKPRQRPPGNKVKSAKISLVAQVEPAYYIFNYDITPIETNITFDSAAAPINPVKPPRGNKKLVRNYTYLLDQVQAAANIYEIIKSQTQCSPSITLEEAAKCNGLLRKALC